MDRTTQLDLRGISVLKGCLSRAEQAQLVTDLRAVIRAAPLFHPETRRGPMSVRMTSAGRLGWVADRRGYRYAPRHPSGADWPPIPQSVLDIWRGVTGADRLPDSMLVNWYAQDARMGMHQDKDEGDFSWPVVSVSLGDSALFRVGSVERGGKTASAWLDSGDVCVMGGDARLVHHGIDRIRFASSDLFRDGGRLNLTLRVVDLPD